MVCVFNEKKGKKFQKNRITFDKQLEFDNLLAVNL